MGQGSGQTDTANLPRCLACEGVGNICEDVKVLGGQACGNRRRGVKARGADEAVAV